MAPLHIVLVAGVEHRGSLSSWCPSTITTPNGFNSPGFANADTHYANSGTTPSNNPHAVSEYDIACYQTGQTH